MDQQQQLKQLQDLFTNAQDILIITKEQPSIDGLCASLGLYGALQGQRTLQGKEKKVIIAVAGKQGSQYTLLPFADKIVSELGLRDFVIGVNGYIENSIQNVNWYADKGRLNVVFKSNPAVPMQFDVRNLDPFYAGANFDVVVVIDTATPSDLGNAYRQDPGMYSELPVVNISTNPQNSRFGKVNIVDSQVPAVSELVYQLTQILRYSVSGDVASLFKLGIVDGTQNLQQKGPQTDAILQQLDSHNARSLDLEAVRQQGANMFVAPQPVQQQQAQSPQQYAPYPAQPFQYPPTLYGVPPYPGYMPPQGYPQHPLGYYPPYPPQYQYPPQAQSTGDYFNQPYQQQNDLNSGMYQQQEGEIVPSQDPNETSSYEVPSIAHDATQQNEYIPTADMSGYGHVEPAVTMQSNTEYPQQYQNYQPQVDPYQNTYQNPVQQPDFSQPPQPFDPNRRK